MRGSMKLMTMIVVAGTLVAPKLFAQPAPGGGPHHGGMNTNQMEWRKEMMQEHEKTMAELKAMDATLDKDVVRMNHAQGSAKTDAMAVVINDLVKEHDLMRNRMEQMHQRMLTHRQQRQRMMGGAEEGTGGSSSSDNAQPQSGNSGNQ